MNLLADSGVPCGFRMGHRVGNMPIQLFQVCTYGGLDFSRKMVTSICGVENFVAFQ